MSDLELDAGAEQAGAAERARELAPALEALLFASGDPVTLEDLRMALPERNRADAEAGLELLQETYRLEPRGLQVIRVAGGYRMATRPEYDRHLRALYRQRNRHRLGRAALETLAVIAYRQPITAPEIGEIRGKDPGGVLKTLLEKKLIRTQGRKRVVGRPFLYGTTREFLVHFGLDSLRDLPSMEEFNAMIAEPELPLDLDPAAIREEGLPIGAVGDPQHAETLESGPEEA